MLRCVGWAGRDVWSACWPRLPRLPCLRACVQGRACRACAPPPRPGNAFQPSVAAQPDLAQATLDAVRKYGKLLVQSVPDRATDLLQRLCTNYSPSTPADGGAAAASRPISGSVGSGERCAAEELIHCFVDRPAALRRFLSGVLAQRDDASPEAWNTLLELLLQQYADVRDGDGAEGGGEQSASKEGLEELEAQIMELMEQPQANYDDVSALCLSQLHQFSAGQLFLYRKLHMYHMVLELYMELDDNAELLRLCKQYGDNDPNLWIQA